MLGAELGVLGLVEVVGVLVLPEVLGAVGMELLVGFVDLVLRLPFEQVLVVVVQLPFVQFKAFFRQLVLPLSK